MLEVELTEMVKVGSKLTGSPTIADASDANASPGLITSIAELISPLAPRSSVQCVWGSVTRVLVEHFTKTVLRVCILFVVLSAVEVTETIATEYVVSHSRGARLGVLRLLDELIELLCFKSMLKGSGLV